MLPASELLRLFAEPSVRSTPNSPVAHPMRTLITPEGYLLTRQVGAPPSNARTGAPVLTMTDAIQMPSAAARSPGTGRNRALRCTVFCPLWQARLCPKRGTRCRPSLPALTRARRKEADPAPDGPADQSGRPKALSRMLVTEVIVRFQDRDFLRLDHLHNLHLCRARRTGDL
jgi:hypothetical protein